MTDALSYNWAVQKNKFQKKGYSAAKSVAKKATKPSTVAAARALVNRVPPAAAIAGAAWGGYQIKKNAPTIASTVKEISKNYAHVAKNTVKTAQMKKALKIIKKK